MTPAEVIKHLKHLVETYKKAVIAPERLSALLEELIARARKSRDEWR